jgi:hypothetical protein
MPSGLTGVCNQERKTIYIASGLEPALRRRVLLHEMCHIGCDGHGKRFQRRLALLAQKGESWAGKERKGYVEAIKLERPISEEVKDVIDDLALELPHLSWSTARAIIEDEIVAPGQLNRIEPWARKRWKERASRDKAAGKLDRLVLPPRK